MGETAASRWTERLTLSQRFAATGGVVMLLAMVTIGLWVTRTIRDNVIDNSAEATALYMESFVAPLAQELETSDTLSIGPVRAIEEMLSDSELGKRIVAIKIWKVGGLVAYSDQAQIVGRRFPISPSLDAALSGRVTAELDELEDEENRVERQKGLPLLEIYSPLRQAYSGKILGAMELYENASELERGLDRTLQQTWAIVAAVTLAIGLALFGIVHRGSRLIARQGEALRQRVAETERMAEENRRLRLRIERASRRVTRSHEATLRRISAELHDGPKQLLGLAALRLGSIRNAADAEARARELDVVGGALDEALREIGNLSTDLSTPEVNGQTLPQVLERVASSHAFRTGTRVERDLAAIDVPVSEAILICAHRFARESLNNAFWHASGSEQRLSCALEGGELTIAVSNGPGTPIKPPDGHAAGLGLAGLRDRVESLGGIYAFERRPDGGALATMRIELEKGANADE